MRMRRGARSRYCAGTRCVHRSGGICRWLSPEINPYVRGMPLPHVMLAALILLPPVVTRARLGRPFATIAATFAREMTMTLVIPREVAERFLDARATIEALRPVMLEEASGTTFHVPPFGGSKSERPTFRMVGGGLYGLGRMGVRAGITQLFDAETGELIAVVGGATRWRVAATMALGADYLARPDA